MPGIEYTKPSSQITARRMARLKAINGTTAPTDAPASSTRPTETLPAVPPQASRLAFSPEPADKPEPLPKQKFVFGEDGFTLQEYWTKKWFRVTAVLVVAFVLLLLMKSFLSIGVVSALLYFAAFITFFSTLGCLIFWRKQNREAKRMKVEMKRRTDQGKKAKPKMMLSHQAKIHHRDQNRKWFWISLWVFIGSMVIAKVISLIMSSLGM